MRSRNSEIHPLDLSSFNVIGEFTIVIELRFIVNFTWNHIVTSVDYRNAL